LATVENTGEIVSRSGSKPTPLVRGKSEVCIAQGRPPYEMVCDVFDGIGVERVIKPGDIVVVKPNFSMLWKLPWKGTLTSREMIEATVKAVKERTDAGQIIIAEGGGGSQTWESYSKFNIVEIARKYGSGLVDLNWDETWKIRIPNAYVMKELWVTKTIHQVADVIISLPVLKVWGSGVTLALKNMIGVAPGRHYGFGKEGVPHRAKNDPNDLVYGQSKTLAGAIVDINYANQANIAIIDALTVAYPKVEPKKKTRIYKGEWEVYPLNAVIGGFDLVATDAVGSAVMCIDNQKVLHLNMAQERDLGVNDLEKIMVIGRSLDEVRHPANPSSPGQGELRLNICRQKGGS
jgi:uncharacterized protein (DUF362 family)